LHQRVPTIRLLADRGQLVESARQF